MALTAFGLPPVGRIVYACGDIPDKPYGESPLAAGAARPSVTGQGDAAFIRKGRHYCLSDGDQMTRADIYIVPTNTWYIERAVWVIAGAFMLTSTVLAAFVDPRFVIGVTATGLASIVVGLTGFCVAGNVLHRLGMRSKLVDPARTGRFLFLRTDSWYLERRIYITVGINLTIASILALVHSPWWLAFTAFVGMAMFWFAATGFCIMANMLYWIGAEPRLAPEYCRHPIAVPSVERR